MALGHLCGRYLELSSPTRTAWHSLVEEATRRINASTFYTGVAVTVGEIANTVRIHDVGELFMYPYTKGMRIHGARCIVAKEHQGWRIASFFLKSYPNARVLVQVRDPRDHAASCKKLRRLYASYHGSIPRASRLWAEEQREALRLRSACDESLVHLITYETLVTRPESTLRCVCRFLEVEWNDAMLAHEVRERARRNGATHYLHNMWAKLDEPVSTASVGRWRETLGRSEVVAVERTTGELLEAFGYRASETPRVPAYDVAYLAWSQGRYFVVTLALWVTWLMRIHDFSVPASIVTGRAVRSHHRYERFRDRLGYRL